MSLYKPKLYVVALFISIPVLLYFFMVMMPLLSAFYYSFFGGTMFNIEGFIGIDNYVGVLTDETFWQALRNNFIIAGLGIIFQLTTSFALAVILYFGKIKLVSYFRAVFFFPVIIAPLVVALLWQIIYNFRFGMLNNILIAVGLEDWRQDWLGNTDIAIFSVAVPLIWQFIGLYMIIMLAGLSNISKDVLEMAEIDGATAFQRAVHIVFPLLKNTINVCLLLSISGGVRIFEQVFVMTMGGPGYATITLAMYSFLHTFRFGNIGYGATIAIMMLIISLLLIAFVFTLRRGERE